MTDDRSRDHEGHAVHQPPPPRTGLKRWTGPGWLRVLWMTPLFGFIGLGDRLRDPLGRPLGPDLVGVPLVTVGD